MKNPVFPIAEVTGNRTVAVDGYASLCHELLPPDLEQLDPDAKADFFQGISDFLDESPHKHSFKFYRLGGRNFLTTDFPNPSIPSVKLVPWNDPLETFFGTEFLVSDIAIDDDFLSFNGRYLRILSATGFGEDPIDEHFIPGWIDYCLLIRKMDKSKALSKLERIRTGHLFSLTKTKRDISGEESYNRAEELIGDLIRGRENLFAMELFFILRADSPGELNELTRNFHADITGRKLDVFVEGQSLRRFKSGLASLFSELIPGVKPVLGLREHIDKTGHLRRLLPLDRSRLMDDGVPFTDTAGRPVFFDPFHPDLKNRNMLVTGASGGGKSVFVGTLIHHLAAKRPVVILDKGGSYRRLALYHDGENVTKGINPLQFRNPAYLREFILSVADASKFDKLARARLLKTLKEAAPRAAGFRELLKSLEPGFPDVSLHFEEIAPYLSESSPVNSNFLYADVDDFPKNFVAPLVVWLLEYFRNIKEPEKVLVFDECWSFLENHAPWIDECFRTFRKTGAFPVAISQSLRDFSRTGIGDSIVNNSRFRVFFPQSLEENDDVDAFDVGRIKSLRFEKGSHSQCYLKSSDNDCRKTLENSLTPLEFEIMHTDAGGEAKLLNFLDRFGEFFDSDKDAIEAFVRLRHEKNNFFDRFININ